MPAPCPQEFREDVVRVARFREDRVTLAQIANDLGVDEMTLHNWIHPVNEVLRRAATCLSRAKMPGNGGTDS